MTQEPFPSLVIGEDRLVPQGSFAEAQAEYLSPDPETVRELDALLAEKKIGVVAHFYMDPELQGVLSACTWPHVWISDSLLMADAAVRMVEAGCERIVVLGVDFMSENARAMLDAAGHTRVPLYRVAAEPIGCSLAESAEAGAYGAYLKEAARTPRSLHVVYINTSLLTKAKSHARVPTITCTSSNVVKTVLAAFAEIENASVFFGPDTYMGRNLTELFTALSKMPEEAVRAVHPAHTPATVRAMLPRFHYFQQGTCIVHHMFGAEVARRVRERYADAFVTAHLEVPGEMFEVALERQREADAGVVGSTSDILGFIERKVRASIEDGERSARSARSESSETSSDGGLGGGAPQLEAPKAPGSTDGGGEERLRFVLGTEAGMITSVVNGVQAILRAHAGSGVEAEIIFPVASEAIAEAPESELAIVPGAMGGEGCSTAGGCATCPYMKMNSLDALLRVARMVGADDDDLEAYHPRKYLERIDGRTTADLGGEPILHMRAFQKSGHLPTALVEDVVGRHDAAAAEHAG